MSALIRICIIYPSDPLGDVPGGIETVIRGILTNSASNIELSVIGVTTDGTMRPPGKWHQCQLAGKHFRFFPVMLLKNRERQSLIPLSLKFTLACALRRIAVNADILEFHRIEPSLAFIRTNASKVAIVHQNKQALRDPNASFRWRYAPLVYERLERYLLLKMQAIYCVREDVVEYYKSQLRLEHCKIEFIPMWVDRSTFYPLNSKTKDKEKDALRKLHGFPSTSRVMIFVGRLDSEKAPLTLLEAFRQSLVEFPDIRLIYIGTGLKETELRQTIDRHQLQFHIVLAGLKTSAQIAKYLRASDLFVMSSVYEGLPIALLEALASGLPAVSTNVGEIKRVVKPGISGEISKGIDAISISNAILKCLNQLPKYNASNCVHAIAEYEPSIILGKLHANYASIKISSY